MKLFSLIGFGSLLAAVFSAVALGAPAGIFSAPGRGQSDRIDPIAAFGVYPTAHEHLFGCGGPVTPTSDSADLRSKPTDCVETGNHSGYWIIRPKQGTQYLPLTTTKPILVYYVCMHSATICSSIDWFPENFGEIAGNPNAASVAENPILNHPDLSGYRCGTGGGTFSNAPPASCASTGVLVLGVTYGNCLMPDGKTTMFVNMTCIAAGGTPIIRRQQYWRFKPVRPGDLSDVTLDGHPTYQLHADILDAWNPITSDDFLKRFVRPKLAGGQNPDLAG